MFRILEDNQTIYNLIHYIDQRIIELKSKKSIDKEIMYISYINSWMESNYIFNVNLSERDEKILIDSLLEFISYLDTLS